MIYKAVCWSKELNSYVSLWVPNNCYQLEYILGGITEAIEDTLGVFCFNSLGAVIKYIIDFFTVSQAKNYVQILEVEGIGNCVTPKYISKFFSAGSLLLYYGGDRDCVIEAPEGTVCYPSVKVIQKVRSFLKNCE